MILKAGLQVHVVQQTNLSWFGYPVDTVPSARNLVPGLQQVMRPIPLLRCCAFRMQQAGACPPGGGGGGRRGMIGASVKPVARGQGSARRGGSFSKRPFHHPLKQFLWSCMLANDKSQKMRMRKHLLLCHCNSIVCAAQGLPRNCFTGRTEKRLQQELQSFCIPPLLGLPEALHMRHMTAGD